MADADFELIRRAWDATTHDDEEAVRSLLHPDVVAVPLSVEGESYTGLEDVLTWWRQNIASWERWEIHPKEFRRVGDKVLVTGHWNVRGRESGVEMERPATWIVEVRDGKIAYWRTYTDRQQALRDLGVE